MNPIVRNVLAVIGGIIFGGIVNMGIIEYGPMIIPAPDGVNPADFESIKANAHLYEFKHYITPFLAHALGTLAGAFLTVKLAANKELTLALIIGGFFLLGGIAAAFMVPEFFTYAIFDILLAYIPFAWLGWKLGESSK